jgi:hypothetical protein
VTLFTLWNEPNHPGFLAPQWRREGDRWIAASADEYRKLVEAGYPAVKRANPGARVLVGATSAQGSSHPGRGGVAPLAFIRRLACVDRALRPIRHGACARFRPLPGDGWAHHPYSMHTAPEAGPRNSDEAPVGGLGGLTALLARLAAEGRIARPDRDVYVTEYGYKTAPPDHRTPFSPAQQAGLLARAEAIASANPAVRMWAQFLLRDAVLEPGSPALLGGQWPTGLRYASGSPKPALGAFRMPTVVRCAAGDESSGALLWARLRGAPPGASPQVQLRADPSGAWRPLASAAIARGAGASVGRRILARAGGAHRLLRVAWRLPDGSQLLGPQVSVPRCPPAGAGKRASDRHTKP